VPAIAESKRTAVETVLKPNFKVDAALKLAAVEEVAAAAVVGVPEPVPAGVMEVDGAVVVTPNPEVLVAGEAAFEVADELLLDLPVELDELLVDVVTLPCAAMEKELLVEYTMPILPIMTASKVYPSPGGTIGSSRVRDWSAATTLLPIANESWKLVFNSSRVKVVGSPAWVVQVIVI
jgi:hypothetical protein